MKDDKNTIRVGTTEGRFRMVMLRLMKEFKEKYPDFDIHGVIGNAEELCSMLERGELDVAFSGLASSRPEKIEREFLFAEKLYLVVSDEMLRHYFQHEYPACIETFKHGADLALFCDMDFSLSLQHLHCMKILNNLLEKEGVVLNCVHRSSHFDLHQDMARENLAACFSLSMYLPHLYRMNEQSSNKLYAFPIKNLRETNPVYILTNRERKALYGVEEFKTMLKRAVIEIEEYEK